MGADIVGVGISPLKNNEMQGLPCMVVMLANKAKIEMTWDTVGIKVPEAMIWWLKTYWSKRNGPLYVANLQNSASHF